MRIEWPYGLSGCAAAMALGVPKWRLCTSTPKWAETWELCVHPVPGFLSPMPDPIMLRCFPIMPVHISCRAVYGEACLLSTSCMQCLIVHITSLHKWCNFFVAGPGEICCRHPEGDPTANHRCQWSDWQVLHAPGDFDQDFAVPLGRRFRTIRESRGNFSF